MENKNETRKQQPCCPSIEAGRSVDKKPRNSRQGALSQIDPIDHMVQMSSIVVRRNSHRRGSEPLDEISVLSDDLSNALRMYDEGNNADVEYDSSTESSPNSVEDESLSFPPGFCKDKSNTDIPTYFLCPITKSIMVEPVIDREGNTFERKAIMRWLDLEDVSPLSRNPLSMMDLVPNRAVKDAIEKARKEAWFNYHTRQEKLERRKSGRLRSRIKDPPPRRDKKTAARGNATPEELLAQMQQELDLLRKQQHEMQLQQQQMRQMQVKAHKKRPDAKGHSTSSHSEHGTRRSSRALRDPLPSRPAGTPRPPPPPRREEGSPKRRTARSSSETPSHGSRSNEAVVANPPPDTPAPPACSAPAPPVPAAPAAAPAHGELSSRHNGWNVPIGVHKITCAEPGLAVTVDIHRRSPAVKRVEKPGSRHSPRDLVIAPGTYVEILETRVHGGRVRGRVVLEEEVRKEIEPEEDIKKKRRSFMDNLKKGHNKHNAKPTTVLTMHEYTGWISLQRADDATETDRGRDKTIDNRRVRSSSSGRKKVSPCPSNARETDEDAGPWTEPIALGVYRISFGNGLPVRQTPERNSPLLGMLERGRYVEVVETRVKGDRVRARCIVPPGESSNGANFTSGWISLLNAITGSSGAMPIVVGTYVVISEQGCVVTDGSSLDSKVRTTLTRGTCVDIVATRIEDGVVRGLVSNGGHVTIIGISNEGRDGTKRMETSEETFLMPLSWMSLSDKVGN